MTERDLVLQAVGGSACAFGRLVIRYQRPVIGYFIARCPADAAELAQEAFVRAWLEVRSLRNADAFGAWLFAICRDLLRAHGSAYPFVPLESEPTGPTEVEPMCEWERYHDLVRVSLFLLEPERRVPVQLRYSAGLSYREISVRPFPKGSSRADYTPRASV